MIKNILLYPHVRNICAVAIILRIVFSFAFADLRTDYYWEYGEIGKNILNGKGYSFFYMNNDALQHRVTVYSSPFPTAYMPPGYVSFLLPFLTIKNSWERNILIILSHIIISVVTIIVLYTIAKNHFSERTAVISGYLLAILPDFMYAVISYTPTIFYHCCTVFVFLLLYTKKNSSFIFILLGIAISITIYMRSEFVVFLFFLLGLFAFQRQWKKILYVSSVVILLLAPWSVRNYLVFHSFVPFTTSMGLNLFRGNNADEIGAWEDSTIIEQVPLLPRNEQFEIEYSRMYISTSLHYIAHNPTVFAYNIPIKLFDLWIYNRHSNRNNNIYNLCSLSIMALFLIGLIRSTSLKHIYFYIFFVYFSFVVSIFFCLPRYQTMMRIGMIPFAAIGIEYIISVFNTKIRH